MEGFIFLLSIIGIGVVILWSKRNDKVLPDGETTGLLAMGTPRHEQKPSPPPRRQWR